MRATILPDALAKFEIMNWRDEQRARVTSTLEDRLHGLLSQTDGLIRDMPVRSMLRPTPFHDRMIAPVVEEWIARQRDLLRLDLESSAKACEEMLGTVRSEDLGWTWAEASTTVAGVALTVGTLVAIPFLGVAAVATTTSFLVFTTAAVSLPVLLGGTAAIAAASLGGYSFRGHAINTFRKRYRQQIRDKIYKQVIGNPPVLDAPSLCRSLCAEIDAVAIFRMK